MEERVPNCEIARAFLHENALQTNMRISRNVLFVVVDDDDNDKTSMKRKGASVRWKELQTCVEGKFEIRKKKSSLFPTTYAMTQFCLAYVGSVR